MTPSFLYFDLGCVLLNFSLPKMLAQIAGLAGLDVETVKDVVFNSGMQLGYEAGRINSQEFYDRFCAATDTCPDFDAMSFAAADIFELNTSIVPVVAQLRAAGYRMGILSNTCPIHWDYCRRRFPTVIDLFDVYVLSYRVKAVKPEPAIFQAAVELAGVTANKIFFVDDIPGHVEGAKAAGFDAVQYTDTPRLAADLRVRGVAFNY